MSFWTASFPLPLADRGEFDFRSDWVVECKEMQEVELVKCTDSENLADIFTKCMGPGKFIRRVEQINSYRQ